MPLNKDQILRYQVLNNCFKNTSRFYDINALVECCQNELIEVYGKSVSKRSVQNDIRLLQFPPYNYNVVFDEDALRDLLSHIDGWKQRKAAKEGLLVRLAPLLDLLSGGNTIEGLNAYVKWFPLNKDPQKVQ